MLSFHLFFTTHINGESHSKRCIKVVDVCPVILFFGGVFFAHDRHSSASLNTFVFWSDFSIEDLRNRKRLSLEERGEKERDIKMIYIEKTKLNADCRESN